jgi:hypothetical protein
MRSPRKLNPEQCRVCGCTYWRPCDDSCGWATPNHDLCTRCIERIVDFATLQFCAARMTPEARVGLLQEIAR